MHNPCHNTHRASLHQRSWPDRTGPEWDSVQDFYFVRPELDLMHVFEEDQVGLDAFLYRAGLMHYLAVVACVHQPLFGARRRQYPDPSVHKVAHDPPSQSMTSRKFAASSL